jgi:hypothetical protein
MESDIQLLARMIVAAREGHQVSSRDAQRLNNLAAYGDSLPREGHPYGDGATTMPEERRNPPATAVPGEVAPGAEYPVVRG